MAFRLLFFISLMMLTARLVAQPVIVNGEVLDSIQCTGESKQTYALYLPKQYITKTKWPAIFFYDPGGRGKMPVSLYLELAERYQCILICSNNSRNGSFEIAQQAEKFVLQDAFSRFSLDSSRLIISGFSGGARAAVYLAKRNHLYSGIIACGAAFPFAEKLERNENIPFAEVIGNRDINLVESVETDTYLNSIGYPHALILFQGTHSWPSILAYETALFWHFSKWKSMGMIDSIKRLSERNMFIKIKQEIDSGEYFMAQHNLSETLNLFLKNASVDSLNKWLRANPLAEKQGKAFNKSLQQETELRKQFLSRFQLVEIALHDSVFREKEWTSFIEGIRKLSKPDKGQDQMTWAANKQMSERILQFMRMICWQSFNAAKQYNDPFHTLLIWRLVALLDNTDQAYLTLAKLYATNSKKPEAIKSLKKAMALGLKDKSLIQNDKDFSILSQESAFKKIIQQLESKSK